MKLCECFLKTHPWVKIIRDGFSASILAPFPHILYKQHAHRVAFAEVIDLTQVRASYVHVDLPWM